MARDRVKRLLVGVDEDERAEIKRRADAACLSVASYLRAAALGRTLRSRGVEREQLEALAAISAQQAELSQNLKTAGILAASLLLKEVEATQQSLRRIAQAILAP